MEIRSNFVVAAGVRTHYIEAGSGEPILLLHGASLAIDAISTWRATVETLAPVARVIAPDNIGFGKTASAPDGRYVDRTRRSGHIKALLDVLDIKQATVIGHSEGGFVALRLAIEHPLLVRSLVVVSSGSAAPILGGNLDDDWKAAGQSVYDYRKDADTVEGFLAKNSPLIHRTTRQTEAMLRTSYRAAVDRGQLKMFRRSAADENNFEAYMAHQALLIEPFLCTLNIPTLLIWGAEDPTAPVERAVKLMRGIVKADLSVLSGASHMVMWDREAAFLRLLVNWLALNGQGIAPCRGKSVLAQC